jgi:flagellum-specific ATP synthase
MTIEAVGLQASLGQQCLIELACGAALEAEVVGFAEHRTFLMPVQALDGIQADAKVIPVSNASGVSFSEQMLGRVINGLGQPLDGRAPWLGGEQVPLQPELINPLQRQPITKPLDVGIRAINALLTIGQGQRVGLFAGSGVGKSVLLGMMTRYTDADVVVVGLIGERGREVQEFIQQSLGAAGLARAVVVASPADDPPLLRLRASQLATRIAEYFRAQGKRVLLLMDSLTRYAQAQREIGLAAGEPPTSKGYPPSVFTKLPQLVERAGNGAQGEGSITAVYTVLTEGDDLQDPIADAARAILDGHIVLSRAIAQEGQYPAIDVEASVSRVMSAITDSRQQTLAMQFKRLMARYRKNQDLINLNAYKVGTDKITDMAIKKREAMRLFLVQPVDVQATFIDAGESLAGVLAGVELDG